MVSFPGQHGKPAPEKQNHSGFCWSKRWWGGSGISWTTCKTFALCSRQTTTPAPHHSIFYRPDALLATQTTVSLRLTNRWDRRQLNSVSAYACYVDRERRANNTHLMAICPGLPGWASTRKVKPICVTARDSEWHQLGHVQICTSTQTGTVTMPAPHHSVFYRPGALSAAQPTASKHWKSGR